MAPPTKQICLVDAVMTWIQIFITYFLFLISFLILVILTLSHSSGSKIGFLIPKFCLLSEKNNRITTQTAAWKIERNYINIYLKYYHIPGIMQRAGEVDLCAILVRNEIITPRDADKQIKLEWKKLQSCFLKNNPTYSFQFCQRMS